MVPRNCLTLAPQALAALEATRSWEGVKAQRVRRVRNGLFDVSKHAHWLRLRLLMPGNYPWQETLDALQDVSAAEVAAHRAALLRRCHVEALVEGNVGADRAAAMCRCGGAALHAVSLHRAGPWPAAPIACDIRGLWVFAALATWCWVLDVLAAASATRVPQLTGSR